MKLPPELLDEIIGQIPRRHLLHSCSFVTKSWTYLCQRHLFKTVKIHPGNLQKWLDNISPANAGLLGHVRVLSYVQSWVYPKRVIGPADHTLREYFPSFRQLRHFNLNSTFSHVSSPLQQLDLSSAFQHTLSDISLAGCSTTKSAFVTLINYFPNLIRLHLRHINYHKEDEPVPPLSRLHLKKLSVIEWSADSLDLIDELSELGLNFEEVVVSDSVFPGPSSSEFSNRVVNAFGATTKCLRLLDTPRDTGLFSTLSHCQELCELEVSALYLNDVDFNLVSSITSTKIEKIIFTHSSVFRLPPGHSHWTRLDDVLTQLVGRLERGLRLEVEFRHVAVTCHGSADLGEHLPMFIMKGRMVVFDVQNELIYCSDDVGEWR